ncbi:hypothetical protein [Longispora urticae]
MQHARHGRLGDPAPRLARRLAGTHFEVAQPHPDGTGEVLWYTGDLPTSAAWRELARKEGQVLHLCGGFDDPRDLTAAMLADKLRVVVSTFAG